MCWLLTRITSLLLWKSKLKKAMHLNIKLQALVYRYVLKVALKIIFYPNRWASSLLCPSKNKPSHLGKPSKKKREIVCFFTKGGVPTPPSLVQFPVFSSEKTGNPLEVWSSTAGGYPHTLDIGTYGPYVQIYDA